MGRDYSYEHAADLAAQLPYESRIARKANPANEWSISDYMLASIEYNIAFIAWSKTKDAKYGNNKPQPRRTPAEAAATKERMEQTALAEIDAALGY